VSVGNFHKPVVELPSAGYRECHFQAVIIISSISLNRRGKTKKNHGSMLDRRQAQGGSRLSARRAAKRTGTGSLVARVVASTTSLTENPARFLWDHSGFAARDRMPKRQKMGHRRVRDIHIITDACTSGVE